jgi:hypothetical protein
MNRLVNAILLVACIVVTILILMKPAHAGACGYPPYPPFGFYPVCVCDQFGQNCTWVMVAKK